jgi:protein-disulfide isomerase
MRLTRRWLLKPQDFKISFGKCMNQLYQNQDQLSGYQLFAYAKGIGLDMVRFEHDIQSQALASKIEADMESGVKSGVSGTPTFYINGEKYEGDWQGDELIQYLKSLL